MSSIYDEFLPPSFTKAASGSPTMLRRLNVARVLEIIRKSGPLTRQDIGVISGLSKPTVIEALDILVTDNLVLLGKSDLDLNARRPGPKAQQVHYNGSRLKVIGLDLGGSTIRILLSDLDGNDLGGGRVKTPLVGGRKAVLFAIRDLVLQTLMKNDLTISEIGSIVVGTPGIVNPENGIVTLAPQLPEWENISLAPELEKLLGVQVIVENEAHLAVLGEHWRGGAQGLRNVAIMSIGIGIGLGLLINGKVFKGSTGAAGEIGNLPLNDWTSENRSGIGLFEFHASVAGIERNFELHEATPEAQYLKSLANGATVTAELIYSACKNNDPLATRLVTHQLESIARGIGSVCCIVNPEVVIIIGGLASALQPHLTTISKQVAKIAPAMPRITLTELRDMSTAIGALHRGIEEVERLSLHRILSSEVGG